MYQFNTRTETMTLQRLHAFCMRFTVANRKGLQKKQMLLYHFLILCPHSVPFQTQSSAYFIVIGNSPTQNLKTLCGGLNILKRDLKNVAFSPFTMVSLNKIE